jgi:hypothetical protein
MTPDSTPGRDRDAAGRPRNARHRDALGRPLPRGVTGIAPVPDELLLSPDDTLREAQRLLDTGLPFQAHEVLEAAWKNERGDERELWQGLAQLAVGLTHALRGNRPGAAALLDRGAGRLERYRARPPHAVDVTGLIAWARQWAAELRSVRAAVTPSAPRLRQDRPEQG